MSDVEFNLHDIMKVIGTLKTDADQAEFIHNRDRAEHTAYDAFALVWLTINGERFTAMVADVQDLDSVAFDLLASRIVGETSKMALALTKIRGIALGLDPAPSVAELQAIQERLSAK
jgi:hypothetical protein